MHAALRAIPYCACTCYPLAFCILVVRAQQLFWWLMHSAAFVHVHAAHYNVRLVARRRLRVFCFILWGLTHIRGHLPFAHRICTSCANDVRLLAPLVCLLAGLVLLICCALLVLPLFVNHTHRLCNSYLPATRLCKSLQCCALRPRGEKLSCKAGCKTATKSEYSPSNGV